MEVETGHLNVPAAFDYVTTTTPLATDNNTDNENQTFHRQGFQKFVISIVDSKLFGGAILFIILLNTIILIIQTDEGTSVKGGNSLSIHI